MLTSLLYILLTGNSLSFSPIGLTYHVYPTRYASLMPARLNSNTRHPITVHPEFNLSYRTKYMQYTGFWMKDSRFNDSFGIIAGPKYDINSYFTLGLAAGFYWRSVNSDYNRYTISRMGEFNLLPFYGANLIVSSPAKLAPELNVVINHILLHVTLGIKYKF